MGLHIVARIVSVCKCACVCVWRRGACVASKRGRSRAVKSRSAMKTSAVRARTARFRRSSPARPSSTVRSRSPPARRAAGKVSSSRARRRSTTARRRTVLYTWVGGATRAAPTKKNITGRSYTSSVRAYVIYMHPLTIS